VRAEVKSINLTRRFITTIPRDYRMNYRSAIARDDLILPATIELVSVFGCEYSFDPDTHTECYVFGVGVEAQAKVWIGTLDRTFSMSFFFRTSSVSSCMTTTSGQSQ
jgi:hypothetical protein